MHGHTAEESRHAESYGVCFRNLVAIDEANRDKTSHFPFSIKEIFSVAGTGFFVQFFL